MHSAIDAVKFILAVKHIFMSDVQPLNDTLSLVQCGHRCVMVSDCVTFLYDQGTGQCYPYPEVYTALIKDQLTKTEGVHLYLDPKAQVCRSQGRYYSRARDKCYIVGSNGEKDLSTTTLSPKAIQCTRLGHSYWAEGDICYRRMPKVTVWATAIQDCNHLNGTMFNVDSDAKHEFYVNVVANQTNRRDSLLGPSKTKCKLICNGAWSWDGKGLTRFWWHDGSPKDWYFGYCIQYTWKDKTYRWENVACYSARPYYCHFSMD